MSRTPSTGQDAIVGQVKGGRNYRTAWDMGVFAPHGAHWKGVFRALVSVLAAQSKETCPVRDADHRHGNDEENGGDGDVEAVEVAIAAKLRRGLRGAIRDALAHMFLEAGHEFYKYGTGLIGTRVFLFFFPRHDVNVRTR